MSVGYYEHEMSDFLKKFLLEDARRFNASGRFAALAAFGKQSWLGTTMSRISDSRRRA